MQICPSNFQLKHPRFTFAFYVKKDALRGIEENLEFNLMKEKAEKIIDINKCFISMSALFQRRLLTDSEAWGVVGRLEESQKCAERAAKATGVSQSVIYKIWSRILKTGSVGRRSGKKLQTCNTT